MQSGYIESFNAKFSDERLNATRTTDSQHFAQNWAWRPWRPSPFGRIDF
jgi:hypothetical protein